MNDIPGLYNWDLSVLTCSLAEPGPVQRQERNHSLVGPRRARRQLSAGTAHRRRRLGADRICHKYPFGLFVPARADREAIRSEMAATYAGWRGMERDSKGVQKLRRHTMRSRAAVAVAFLMVAVVGLTFKRTASATEKAQIQIASTAPAVLTALARTSESVSGFSIGSKMSGGTAMQGLGSGSLLRVGVAWRSLSSDTDSHKGRLFSNV